MLGCLVRYVPGLRNLSLHEHNCCEWMQQHGRVNPDRAWWARPPHDRADMDNSPIPESFFKQAAGDVGSWDLRRVHNKDLVPVEQPDVVQDIHKETI